jgi:chromate reductase
MFVYLDAHLLNKPEIMIGAAASRFGADGTLTDEATRKLLAQLVTALRDWTHRLRGRS